MKNKEIDKKIKKLNLMRDKLLKQTDKKLIKIDNARIKLLEERGKLNVGDKVMVVNALVRFGFQKSDCERLGATGEISKLEENFITLINVVDRDGDDFGCSLVVNNTEVQKIR